MPRKKKSRKIGLIGVRKAPKEPGKPFRDTTGGKPKKKTGRPAGSRHSVKQEQTPQNQQQPKDPRLGSKKPIPLVVKDEVKKATAKPKKKYFSPSEELAAIEADKKLDALLDKLDDGVKLDQEEQAYVDEKMARHKALCELLGINPEEDADEADEDDPLARFDAIDPRKL